MVSRREFLQAAVAVGAIAGGAGGGTWQALAARQQLMSEADLLQFPTTGNVTLVHVTDIHAQLKPIYFREPSINLGVGEVAGKPPHVTGKDFLKLYKIKPETPMAYALTSEDYVALAKEYGRMGGIDRIATVLNSIRAERADNMLFLDGGDTWQGSYTSLKTAARTWST
jgi:sulfur-oxidizing protein SoxB